MMLSGFHNQKILFQEERRRAETETKTDPAQKKKNIGIQNTITTCM
jgi:hypothetical protein